MRLIQYPEWIKLIDHVINVEVMVCDECYKPV